MKFLWLFLISTILLAGEKQGFLGAALATNPDGATPGKGLLVYHIYPDSGAAKAGIRENDWVVSLDGEPVTGMAVADRVLARFTAHENIEVGLLRGKQKIKVNVELGERPEASQAIAPFVGERISRMLKLGRYWLGFKGHDLGSQLAQTLDVAGGVLVDTVFDEGPANDAGIRSGDVVVAVEGAPVKSLEEIGKMLAPFEEGGAVLLTVSRAGLEMDLELPLVALGDVPDIYKHDILRYLDLPEFGQNIRIEIKDVRRVKKP